MPKNERDLIKAEFAKRLGGHMERRSWNQSDMARAAQKFLPKGETFRRDSIHTYLNQIALPRPKQLNAIAKALDVQPADLLPGVANSDRLPYSMRPVDGEANMSWLSVDMKVPMRKALAVLSILGDD